RRVRQDRRRRYLHSHHRAQSRTGSGATLSAADIVVSQSVGMESRSAAARDYSGTADRRLSITAGELRRSRRPLALCRRRAPAAVYREREQRAAAVGLSKYFALRERRIS